MPVIDNAAALIATLNLTPPQTLRAWQVGQLLDAFVVAQAGPQQTVLRIDGQTLTTRMPFPVNPGQRLTLEVMSASAPVTLKIIPPAAAPAQADPSNLLLQALRSALPKQAPLAPLLAELVALTQHKPATPLAASAQFIHALSQHLLNSVMTSQSVGTGHGLLQALKNSGLLLEAKLAHAAAPAVEDDLKAGLVRLRAALLAQTEPQNSTLPATQNRSATPHATVPGAAVHGTPATAVTPVETAPPDNVTLALLRHVEGGLARIQMHQLAALPNEGAAPLLIDLPIRHGERTDVFQLRIDPEQGGTSHARAEPAQAYSVKLSFDLPGLGPVHASIGLNQHSVSTQLWAEHAATAALVNEHIPTLRDRLAETGLVVQCGECVSGCPPATQEYRAPLTLMSTHA